MLQAYEKPRSGRIGFDGTWDAIEGAFSGGRHDDLPEAFALTISTPGPPAGRFYRSPGLEGWWARHVTLAEAVAAGRISEEWAAQRARQWGADSAMYANRVLGEFHASDEDSVIPLAWVEAAMERWRAWVDAGRPALDGPRYIGVDVARSGADSTIFAHRHGAAITHIDAYSREDTMRTTARIQAVTGTAPVDGQWATRPVVDSVGVGGGVVDRLRERGVPALAYTGAAKAHARTRDRDREWGFTNTRGAAYWRLRELLDPAFRADIMLPEDDLLTADLTAPTWDVTTGVPPRIKVEPKDDVAARLGRSPDRGDAVAMAYWAENLAASRLSAPLPNRDGGGGRSAAAARLGRAIGGGGAAKGRS